ncbi:MAG TPA: flavodoxin domain-containing protein [Pseudonocardia sp.]|nr:flavodoxin domain-containing protein [Pseudonocardia sp.]
MRVLVAYASKFGSTAEIADAIADEIRGCGLDVDVVEAGRVRDVTPYGAVVLGSALYAGRWRRPAVGMLRRHRRELAGRPLRLFHSGPLDAEGERQPPPKAVARMLPALGADEPVTFGGRLEKDTARGFIARKMVDNGHGGDFRDWDAIRAWARDTAGSLAATGGREGPTPRQG